MTAFQAGLIILRMEKFTRVDDLNGTDVLVLAVLFSFAGENKGDEPLAWPSASKVAARARVDLRTVQRSLGRLEKVGAIIGEHRFRRPTIWSLHASLRKGRGRDVDTDSYGRAPQDEADSYGRATHDIRQSAVALTSQSRKPYVTESYQGTETYRRGVPNRTEDGSPTGAGAPAALRTAPSGPPLGDDDSDDDISETERLARADKEAEAENASQPNTGPPAGVDYDIWLDDERSRADREAEAENDSQPKSRFADSDAAFIAAHAVPPGVIPTVNGIPIVRRTR